MHSLQPTVRSAALLALLLVAGCQPTAPTPPDPQGRGTLPDPGPVAIDEKKNQQPPVDSVKEMPRDGEKKPGPEKEKPKPPEPEKLAALKNLKYQGVSGKGITDNGMMKLKPLVNLRHLQLAGTSTTSGGIDELRKTLPMLGVGRTGF